jgi:hypothetical protein
LRSGALVISANPTKICFVGSSHDLVIEGIDAASCRCGYPSVASLKARKKR